MSVRAVIAVVVLVAACTTGPGPGATSPGVPLPTGPATAPTSGGISPLPTATAPVPTGTPDRTSSAPPSAATSTPGATASPAPPAEGLVSGVVLSVDSAGLTDVRGFTLRTSEGEVLAFRIGTLAPGPETFPAGHLREHLSSAAPVEVRYRREGETLFAIRLRDAEI